MLIGVVIVVASLFMDAMQSSSQDYLLNDLKVSDPEMMTWTNLLSSAGMFIVSLFAGEMGGTFEYLELYPHAILIWIGRTIVMFFGIKYLVRLMFVAGNVTSTVVGTVRKVMTIVLSFIIFNKPFLPKYVLGLLFFLLSFVVDLVHRRQKAAAAAAAASLLPMPAGQQQQEKREQLQQSTIPLQEFPRA
jgi:adenosine 3'-phospho 5'-phosphosulfate transporter B3